MGLGGGQAALAQSADGQPEAAAADGVYISPDGLPPGPREVQDAASGEADIRPRRGWSIVPRLRLGETFTDNVAPATGDKRSDQITEISPGIRIDNESERLTLHLNYQLRQLLYAQESEHHSTQHHLNAFGTLEAVDKWLFLDVSGVITQQEISPFRPQTASNVNIDPNRVETSSFRASPYVRGRLGQSAEYEVRYNRSATRSSSAFVSDVDTEEWTGTVKAALPQAPLGWELNASHRNIDYQGGRDSEEDRFRGLVAYRIHPELRLSASVGEERNNFVSADKENHRVFGYGFDWQPSVRTHVSAFREKRFFGYGHVVSIDHRTPLTALRFSDVRDVSVLPNRYTTVGFGTIYDLLFTQLTTAIPDPATRAAQVDNLLDAFGIPPDVTIARGFLSSRVSVLRRQELAYALYDRRNVLTLMAARTEHEAIGPAAGATDVFSTSPIIRQRGFSINLSHRLTPLSSVGAIASQQTNTGDGGLSTELRSLHLVFTTRLGQRTTASVAVRRALFDSETTASYTENALIGTLTMYF